MPISLILLLVAAGIVLLAFGFGSTGGAIRFLTGGAALLIAIVATAATALLFWLGQQNHWTSDGPGMLFVMIGVVVFGVVAAVSWPVALRLGAGAPAAVDGLPDLPPGVKRVFLLTGFALLGAAAVGLGMMAFAWRGRTAHASAVVSVSFDPSRPRLVSLDSAGTLVGWDLRSGREERRLARPGIAGATEFFTAADHGYAIVKGQALRFPLFGEAPAETIPDARHIARSGYLVVAGERTLRFASHAGWAAAPDREMAWPEKILAIGANDDFVAVADRAQVTLLDGRLNSVRTHGSMSAPSTITKLEVRYDGTVLAFDGSGAGWSLDVRRGTSEKLEGRTLLVADHRHTFFISGRTVSEYDPRKKTTAPLATIGAGGRCVDTRHEQVAFGFENGEVLLGTLNAAKLELKRLTAKPAPAKPLTPTPSRASR